MKIAIDLTALVPRPSGVDRYLIELVRHLARIDSENHYSIFVNYEDRHVLDGQLPANFRTLPRCLRPRPVRLLFQQIALPMASMDIDVIHSPSFILPLVRGWSRHLLSVHDLTFFSMPEAHNGLRSSRGFRRFILESMRRADLIKVPSESARNEVLTVLPQVSSDRIRVVPYGIDDCFQPAPESQVRTEIRRLGLPEHYILYVGSIEPRKNLHFLLESYEHLVAEGAIQEHLVIAGDCKWGYEAVVQKANAPALRDRVHLTGFVRQADLPWIYRGARLFVYPSLFEGFGFPPLEAMACGVPAITTRSSSLVEYLTGAAELVPPGDAGALSAAIRKLVSDEGLRKYRIKAGLERAAGFSWEYTARRTIDCYRELALSR